jgi:thioredoxin-like negative regulator of GroEL
MTERDRDETGRARNARPRDAYGRPLPHDAEGEERVPDDYTAAPEEALAEAQRLLDADRPFHAHEVLEAAWKAAPESERELWKGLAQLAVGFTHIRRGNAQGAQSLLRRAGDRIADYDPAPYGIAAPALARHAHTLADHIERDGVGSITDADLTPRLTGPAP